ncbi:MAG: arginine N-succinyltransferase [Candidatus Dadabacteria bacterium]|nr:arginine N-succinyltransferase [Candidatus Dadabacteria bacterium]
MIKNEKSYKQEIGSASTVFLIFVLIIIIGGVVWVKYNIYANPFKPTILTPPEKIVLDNKIKQLNKATEKKLSTVNTINFTDDRLEPEPYSEKNAKREITITERELNSLVKDPEIAKRVAVDLSEDLLSVKLIIPMDEEFPVLGGTNIKLHFGTVLAYSSTGLVVSMKGVSIGGIPLPSAWWGGIKNQNLVEYFGGNDGFWDTLSRGISDIKISDEEMYVKLKE